MLARTASPQSTQSRVRYIKLGPKGSWARIARDQGIIPFGSNPVPHEIGQSRNVRVIRNCLLDAGYTARGAAQAAREIVEFYTPGADTLWITFHQGQMWWAHAQPEVLEAGDQSIPAKLYRRTVDGWHTLQIDGRSLLLRELSGRITKTAGYRRTICTVDEAQKVIDLVNGVVDPMKEQAADLTAKMTTLSDEAIQRLHPRDFEILIDLLLSRGGWQRMSELGGQQPEMDLTVTNPLTGETAFVQVKCRAEQRDLDNAIAACAGESGRLIFVYHTSDRTLSPGREAKVDILTGKPLAAAVIRSGLFEWLMKAA